MSRYQQDAPRPFNCFSRLVDLCRTWRNVGFVRISDIPPDRCCGWTWLFRDLAGRGQDFGEALDCRYWRMPDRLTLMQTIPRFCRTAWLHVGIKPYANFEKAAPSRRWRVAQACRRLTQPNDLILPLERPG